MKTIQQILEESRLSKSPASHWIITKTPTGAEGDGLGSGEGKMVRHMYGHPDEIASHLKAHSKKMAAHIKQHGGTYHDYHAHCLHPGGMVEHRFSHLHGTETTLDHAG